MDRNLILCMPEVFKHEGGYVNHPRDPGGETNLGITHRTLQTARRTIPGLPPSVKNLTKWEASIIYEHFYWKPVGGPVLPGGVDYVAFDGGINSGPARGVRWVQQAVGATPDGAMGPRTLAAVRGFKPVAVVERACSNRRGFLRGLSTFNVFGKGWTRRVNEVEAFALKLAVMEAPHERATTVGRAEQRARTEATRTGQTAAGGAAATGGTSLPDFTLLPDWAPWLVGALALVFVINQLGRLRIERGRKDAIKEALA